jgi:hypothetical protein
MLRRVWRFRGTRTASVRTAPCCGLGFELVSGGETQSFTSFAVGPGHLNLLAVPSETRWSWWGRIILHVDDVDALYARARFGSLVRSRGRALR